MFKDAFKLIVFGPPFLIFCVWGMWMKVSERNMQKAWVNEPKDVVMVYSYQDEAYEKYLTGKTLTVDHVYGDWAVVQLDKLQTPPHLTKAKFIVFPKNDYKLGDTFSFSHGLYVYDLQRSVKEYNNPIYNNKGYRCSEYQKVGFTWYSTSNTSTPEEMNYKGRFEDDIGLLLTLLKL